MKKLVFIGYMMLEEEDGPYCVVLREEPIYHEYDEWSGFGPDDKMIRSRTKRIYLSELIGQEMLDLPVVGRYGDSVLCSGNYECGKVRITIESMDEGED